MGREVASRDKLADYTRSVCAAVAFTVCVEDVEEGLAQDKGAYGLTFHSICVRVRVS
jgi:hypothetical protein